MARDPWLDDYVSGSFRGIPFKLKSHSTDGGRRKQDREFAKRDTGNSEDLGKKLKGFILEMYVIGSDVFAQRDALEEALDAEGAGELIHPYRGTINVQAGKFTTKETVEETRVARITAEFTEAGELKFPDQVEDDISDAQTKADESIENSKGFFESIFDTANKAAFVIQAAADDTAALVDSIENAVTKITEPVANITFAIRNLKADINDLIKLPGELADRIGDVLSALIDEFQDDPDTARRVLSAFVGGVDLLFEPVIGDTLSRVTQRVNQTAIANLGKEMGLSNQAIATVDVDFASTQEAIESRDEVVTGLAIQLDVISEGINSEVNATDDELFQSIRDLQTALARALPRTGTTELLTVTPVQTIPALVLAYSLFEDIDKEQEIIDQNDVEHPGFVPGGDPIQVSTG